MSCITDSKTLEDAFQPSLIYPSLSHYPKVVQVVPDEKTDLQACIHFASRLIKLRSELRSSSYMSSSTSLQLLKSTPIPPTSSSSVSSASSSSTTMTENEFKKPLNEATRIHSLPNVNQYLDDNDSFMDNREDESEIMDKLLSLNGKRPTSQLTYLTEIIRQSVRRRQGFHSQSDQFYLALPPKDSLRYSQMKKSNSSHSTTLSSVSSANKKIFQKSTSLRDILLLSLSQSQSEVKQKPQNQEEEKQQLKAMLYRQPNDYPSFTLASQLVTASTAHAQGEDERNRKKKQKEVKELELLSNNMNQEDKSPRRNKSVSTIATSDSSYHTSNDTINDENDDNDDGNDDDDSETESEVILRHAVPATAFLVSLSPSAAAAASAARFRRRRPILHEKDNKNSSP